MPKAYSADLRERIVKSHEECTPIEDIVVQYSVSRSSVYSYLKQFRETGTAAPQLYHPGRKKKLAPYETEVRQVIAEHPDGTLADFCNKLSSTVVVSTTTLCDYLRYL